MKLKSRIGNEIRHPLELNDTFRSFKWLGLKTQFKNVV